MLGPIENYEYSDTDCFASWVFFVLYGQEVVNNSYRFLLHEMGHYFLDMQYVRS